MLSCLVTYKPIPPGVLVRACRLNAARWAFLLEVFVIAAQDTRINGEIHAPQLLVIGVDGTKYEMSNDAAQRFAEDQGLDLVEVAPNAEPPVCRVMDYGKYKYEQAVKAKKARKNQTKIEVKEMKFRPKIDTGDYETKVKITIMFRGREMAHPEQGLTILERLADDLKDLAVVEQQPKMEGRNMHMMVAPLPKDARKNSNKEDEDKE